MSRSEAEKAMDAAAASILAGMKIAAAFLPVSFALTQIFPFPLFHKFIGTSPSPLPCVECDVSP